MERRKIHNPSDATPRRLAARAEALAVDFRMGSRDPAKLEEAEPILSEMCRRLPSFRVAYGMGTKTDGETWSRVQHAIDDLRGAMAAASKEAPAIERVPGRPGVKLSTWTDPGRFCYQCHQEIPGQMLAHYKAAHPKEADWIIRNWDALPASHQEALTHEPRPDCCIVAEHESPGGVCRCQCHPSMETGPYQCPYCPSHVASGDVLGHVKEAHRDHAPEYAARTGDPAHVGRFDDLKAFATFFQVVTLPQMSTGIDHPTRYIHSPGLQAWVTRQRAAVPPDPMPASVYRVPDPSASGPPRFFLLLAHELDGPTPCSQCQTTSEDLYYHGVAHVELCGECLLGEGICHLCKEHVSYCQGHGDEMCGCVCEEGCLCGDCGFDELARALELCEGYPI